VRRVFHKRCLQKLTAGINSEPLTEREAEVLKLLACGKSNKEIGASLFISEFTVKGHLRNIFSKLNVLSARKPFQQPHSAD